MKNILVILGALIMMILAPSAIVAQNNSAVADSIKNIFKLASEGNAMAQNEVGSWYFKGQYVGQDFNKAVRWWAKSAQQGNMHAIGNLGLCYHKGHGVAADSLKAVQFYLRSIREGNGMLLANNEALAKKGNAFSAMLVAACYKNGIGVPKDNAKAIQYLKAAAANSVSVQKELGMMLINEKKPAEAAGWFKMGAKSGDVNCTYFYGKMLLDGLGVKQDKSAGADYLLKAALKGLPQAMLSVGNCYMGGDGLTKNEEQGFKWYAEAAKRGLHKADWNLAQCYREGKGTDINYERALYWYAQASANGFSRDFKALITDSIPNTPFTIYLKGMKAYLNQDFEEAMTQFKRVTKAKIADGRIMEATVMINPNNPKRNARKAIGLLKASSNSNPQVSYLLGTLYEAGDGTDKDMTLAVSLIEQAAELGYAPAECRLADMFYEGRGVEQSYTAAAAWYGKAYERGELNKDAARRYSTCLDEILDKSSKDKIKGEELLIRGNDNHIGELLKLE